MSDPGLLAVGQFVFTGDKRVRVETSPADQRWSLSITVSSDHHHDHYDHDHYDHQYEHLDHDH